MLILESIFLKNIRSYKKIEINLSPGILLFSGNVGSGKSTILMAIEFALFGLGNQRGDSLLKKDKNSGEVELTFSIDDKQCIIKRILQRNDSTGNITQGKGTIHYNGEKLELSPAELKEEILRIIDFKEDINPRSNSNIFRYAVYTPQEEMKEIINKRADERMQTLRKAFGIEDYKTSTENAEHLIKDFKGLRNYYKGKLEQYEEIKEEITEGKNYIESLKLKLVELEEEKEKAKTNLEYWNEKQENTKNIKKELEKWEIELNYSNKDKINKISKINELETEIKDLESYLNTYLLKHLEKLKEYEDIKEFDTNELEKRKERVKSLLAEQTEKELDIKRIEKRIEEIDNKLGNIKDKGLKSIKTFRNKILSKIESLESNLREINAEIMEETEIKLKHESELVVLQERLDKIKESKDKCPVCDSELTAEKTDNLIDTINYEMKKHKKRTIKSNQTLDELKHEKKHMESDLSELNNKSVKWDNLIVIASEKKELTSILEETKESLQKYELPLLEFGTEANDCLNLEEYLEKITNELGRWGEIKANKERLDETKRNIEKTKRDIKKRDESLEEYKNDLETRFDLIEEQNEIVSNLNLKYEKDKQSIESYQIAKQEFNKIKKELIKTNTFLESESMRLTRTKEKISKLNKLGSKDKEIEEITIWLKDYFINAVKLIEKNILSELYHELNENFRRWFSVLVEDETKSARLNIEFTPIIEQGQIEQDINYLSGGEKTSVALAYRLALNKLVKKVSVGMKNNLLILDEPTDGLSGDQLLKLKEILDEMECNQIIIVSHEPELENLADNVIEIEKTNGISTIKEII